MLLEDILHRLLEPGLDFINILQTAFMPVAPQSVRTQSSCQYLFTLSGSTSVKAVCRTLMKLTPGLDLRLLQKLLEFMLLLLKCKLLNHLEPTYFLSHLLINNINYSVLLSRAGLRFS